MTYIIPSPDEPLKQGDIFFPLRSVATDPALDPTELPDKLGWRAGFLDDERQDVVIQLRARKTWAILTTQDCDALHVPTLSFHSILPFAEVFRSNTPGTPKKWMELITKHAKYNPHWFYLPADPRFGFQERMAVSFPDVFQVRKTFVEGRRATLRRARLDGDALSHFRETLARFYIRLAYDEWYPLTPEEREWYDGRHSGESGPLRQER